MPFKLPEEMPTGIEELSALREAAQDDFTRLRTVVEEGGSLSDEDVAQLRYVVDALSTIGNALADAEVAALSRDEEIAELFAQGEAADEDEADEDEAEAEVVEEAEAIAEEAATVTASAPGKGLVRRGVSGLQKGRAPKVPAGTNGAVPLGFRIDPSAPDFREGRVGFKELAEAIDSVKAGSRARAGRPGALTNFAYQTLARLDRDLPEVTTPHELVAAIEAATDPSQLREPQFDKSGSLVAAGGWCAPSEQLYDFCEVPTATDLLSLPEITIRRGGVRWPIEPDLTAIFESFEFFFTEPELEADPPPLKECVEIPCPDEFEELRLNAVGYCVEAGILQTQGWPELIEWFMRSLAQEHFRALSRRTILNMVNGSTPVVIPEASQIAAGSSVLNSVALMAMNLRLDKGLARNATIEGVAPSWLHEVIRADLANQQGTETKNITDAQINGWLSARNVALQFVGDWQTRELGMPGNMATVEYPGTVQIILYPAGTWFRALDNVIQFGVLYPRELLQINRYTRFFTEDAYAVGKRCNKSIVVTIPICPNGAYGAQDSITCNAPANEVQAVAITGTAPTGGTFTLTFQGQTTGPIAYNATAAAVKTALDALSNLETTDTTTAGGALPGVAVTVTFQGRYAGANVTQMTADGALLTGGDATTLASVVTTTQGGS